MPNFSYKALGRDGKEVRGVLQAESEAAAASRIRENYPILLSISQKKEKKRPDDGSLLEMEIGSRRIKTKKLAILCSQFAITLHSGMTVARAMRMLADQNEDKRIRKIMGAAAEEARHFWRRRLMPENGSGLRELTPIIRIRNCRSDITHQEIWKSRNCRWRNSRRRQ